MRTFASLAALLALASLVSAADTKFNLTGTNTKIVFVGTKPDGKHDGGFKTLKGTATVSDKDITTLKLDVTINTTSMYSDNTMLTGHLKSPDFFNVKKFPTAKFVSTKVAKEKSGYLVTGDLTLLGKTKSVSFPADITVTGGKMTLSSDFKIDRQDFGMTYGKGKVDDAVSIKVTVAAGK